MADWTDFTETPVLKYIYCKDQISGLQGFFDLDGILHRVIDLEIDGTRLKNDILELKGEKKTRAAAMATMQQAADQVNTLRTDVASDVKTQLDDYKAAQELRLKRVEEYKQSLSDLQQKCSGLAASVNDLSFSLSETAHVTKLLKAHAVGNTDDIRALTKSVDDLTEALDAAQTTLESVQHDYLKLDKDSRIKGDLLFSGRAILPADPVYPDDAANKYYVDKIAQSAALPVGSVVMFAGTNLPDGFLWCDGSILDKADYPELNKALGDIGGDSTLTFALPTNPFSAVDGSPFTVVIKARP